jgi:hypothetical protein
LAVTIDLNSAIFNSAAGEPLLDVVKLFNRTHPKCQVIETDRFLVVIVAIGICRSENVSDTWYITLSA